MVHLEQLGLLCRLLWQPGAWLHSQWWSALELASWRHCYPTLDDISQRELDRLICQRRGFPLPMMPVPELNPLRLALLRALPRLPALLTALGLVLLACPGYLIWRPYRQALSSCLHDQQLQQLAAIWRGGTAKPLYSPTELPDRALALGHHCLSRGLTHEPLWQAIGFTLPCVTPLCDVADSSSTVTVATFLRLEKFL
ncbi:type III secretion system domain-containing protein [Serratia quinivorans]|uniref:type III secretion system domain-containing protein n=1 Tax=Serratia quinivorans TaxID=137545 RepID=UPI0021790D0E|nr:type III secretion system domain-containing protein [Serratia quinivorans]CAI1009582.1 Uncharacterised protein [Serratia quinivorans]CAI1810069.1 Uncharacterised protein [Serratia quinivorans]